MNSLTSRPTRIVIGLLASCLALPAFAANMNKSIRIDDGAQTGGKSTVNGSITVGRDAVIDGSLNTVNGSITVHENVQLRGAETVNGSIKLADNVRADHVSSVNGTIRLADNVSVNGDLSVVNGRVMIGNASRVARDVSNVNGEIEVRGGAIGGDLTTVNGDILLTDSAVLSGDLIVEKPGGWNRGRQREPRIVIGPGSRIDGTIRLERKVELYISDSATVGGVSGEMTLADAVRFSGERP